MKTQKLRELAQIINAQAEDEGLWFIAKTAPEAYLQQELRKLHSAVEAACPANILALLDSRADLLEALQTVQTLIHGGMDGTDDAIYKCVSAAITKAEAL